MCAARWPTTSTTSPKTTPDLALQVARGWLVTGGDRAASVVRHGLRTLVKHGDPAALALLGFDHITAGRLDRLTVAPQRLPIGGEVIIELTLSADDPVRVVVHYRVHHAGTHGRRGPKLFKLTTRTIEPGRPHTFTRRHRFREVSVRRLYPGIHRIDIQINGRALGSADIQLLDNE